MTVAPQELVAPEHPVGPDITVASSEPEPNVDQGNVVIGDAPGSLVAPEAAGQAEMQPAAEAVPAEVAVSYAPNEDEGVEPPIVPTVEA